MRAMIEAVESRLLMAAQLPSPVGLIQAASATRVTVRQARVAAVKSIAAIRADLTRLKLRKSHGSILRTIATDSASASQSLSRKITVANATILSTYRMIAVDLRAYEKQTTDPLRRTKLQGDLHEIVSRGSDSLTDLLDTSAKMATTFSNNVLQLGAADPNDEKLQSDVQAALATQNDAQSGIAAAAQFWLGVSIANSGL